MKLLQIVKKNFEFLGIGSKRSFSNNIKSVIAILIFSLSTSLGTVFLLFEANTFLEYTTNIYVTTTTFGALVEFISILFQKKNLFKLIDEMENFVDTSECIHFGISIRGPRPHNLDTKFKYIFQNPKIPYQKQL